MNPGHAFDSRGKILTEIKIMASWCINLWLKIYVCAYNIWMLCVLNRVWVIVGSFYKVLCVYLEVTLHVCGKFLIENITMLLHNCRIGP